MGGSSSLKFRFLAVLAFWKILWSHLCLVQPQHSCVEHPITWSPSTRITKTVPIHGTRPENGDIPNPRGFRWCRICHAKTDRWYQDGTNIWWTWWNTFWWANITMAAMENGPSLDDWPLKNGACPELCNTFSRGFGPQPVELLERGKSWARWPHHSAGCFWCPLFAGLISQDSVRNTTQLPPRVHLGEWAPPIQMMKELSACVSWMWGGLHTGFGNLK